MEDEPLILKLTTRILERIGYKVIAFSNPMEVIQSARNADLKKVDLLLTDVVMPDITGDRLYKELLEIFPDLKCLFMSGYTADVISENGFLNKGIHFINKPFSRIELSKKIGKILDDIS